MQNEKEQSYFCQKPFSVSTFISKNNNFDIKTTQLTSLISFFDDLLD